MKFQNKKIFNISLTIILMVLVFVFVIRFVLPVVDEWRIHRKEVFLHDTQEKYYVEYNRTWEEPVDWLYRLYDSSGNLVAESYRSDHPKEVGKEIYLHTPDKGPVNFLYYPPTGALFKQ